MALPAPYSRTIELSRDFTGLTATQVAELLEAQYHEMCDKFEVRLQPYSENDDVLWNATVYYSKSKLTGTD